jgi:hypothetical protein
LRVLCSAIAADPKVPVDAGVAGGRPFLVTQYGGRQIVGTRLAMADRSLEAERDICRRIAGTLDIRRCFWTLLYGRWTLLCGRIVPTGACADDDNCRGCDEHVLGRDDAFARPCVQSCYGHGCSPTLLRSQRLTREPASPQLVRNFHDLVIVAAMRRRRARLSRQAGRIWRKIERNTAKPPKRAGVVPPTVDS